MSIWTVGGRLGILNISVSEYKLNALKEKRIRQLKNLIEKYKEKIKYAIRVRRWKAKLLCLQQ